jgi:hypothetical protein
MLQRRDEVVDDGVCRGNVNARRKHVIARLAGIHVVVRVDLPAQAIAGERRQHLVHVHVAARPGPRLEHVDRELAVPPAGGHLLGGCRYGLGDVIVHDAEFRIDGGSRCFDSCHGSDLGRFERRAADREVLDRPLGLCPVFCRLRDLYLAHRVTLYAELSHGGHHPPWAAIQAQAD